MPQLSYSRLHSTSPDGSVSEGPEDSFTVQRGHTTVARGRSILICAACVLVSFTLGYMKASYDAAKPDAALKTAPNQLRDYFERPGVYELSSRFTQTPFSRSEDSHLDHHPWRWGPSQGLDHFFHTHANAKGRIFLLSADDLRSQGKDPDQYVRIPSDWGYGDNSFPTQFDQPHQLHCLYTLFQAIYPAYYNASFNDQDRNDHMEHCFWSLYDYLACHVSLDTYNFKWLEGLPRPFQDFESTRQCRDMDALTRYYEEHDVSTDARIHYLVPRQGDTIHPVSDPRKEQILRGVRLVNEELGRDWLQSRKAELDRAVSEWKSTGTVPRVKDETLV